jgi:hypothetical protein
VAWRLISYIRLRTRAISGLGLAQVGYSHSRIGFSATHCFSDEISSPGKRQIPQSRECPHHLSDDTSLSLQGKVGNYGGSHIARYIPRDLDSRTDLGNVEIRNTRRTGSYIEFVANISNRIVHAIEVGVISQLNGVFIRLILALCV